jgi:phosphopantetheine adenylyltransferase
LKENVKKFSERTKNLREILEEYRQFEVYYDPVEENVAFTNYQTAKFFRGLGFEVLVVSKEEDKELEKEFEIIKVEV